MADDLLLRLQLVLRLLLRRCPLLLPLSVAQLRHRHPMSASISRGTLCMMQRLLTCPPCWAPPPDAFACAALAAFCSWKPDSMCIPVALHLLGTKASILGPHS